MRDLGRWIRLSLQFLSLAIVLTACFRDTSEAIQQQPVAREYASPTTAPQLEPTAAPATHTVEAVATEQIADQFALTATALIARQTEPAADQQIPSDTGSASDAGLAAQASAVPLIRSTIPPGEDCVHEIRAGETLFQLSLAYGVTVEAIADASEIDNPDRITVGQPVTIPLCGTTGFIPPPTSIPPPTVNPALIAPTADTSELEIASSDDTRDALIEQAQETLLENALTNPLDDFSAQAAGVATPSREYTVQQNDTLFEIAVSFGTSVEVLAALNDITDVDSLNAGEVLIVP